MCTRELFEHFQQNGLVPVADVPATECGAVVQSAANVLRSVMLFKGLESFVRMSILRAMGHAVDGFLKGWQAYQSVRFRREELLQVFVAHIHVAMEHMAFKWMVSRLVSRWARTLILIKASKELERVSVNMLGRGATRQWCTKVRRWNSVQCSRWIYMLVQWDIMMDILAECRTQKLG